MFRRIVSQLHSAGDMFDLSGDEMQLTFDMHGSERPNFALFLVYTYGECRVATVNRLPLITD